MKYSDEQNCIIEMCASDKNTIVDAVAGSGKTTTLLGIAQASPHKKMLGVLYNRSLKEETRLRAQSQGLPHLEIHNYHALARRYYDNSICNDNGITKMLSENVAPIRSLPRWDRFILDEVQDMTPLYYELICKIIIDLRNPNLKLTVMGDRYQSIYSYMAADSRFLTHANKLYTIIKGPWANASLSTTYRCSSSICSFINESLLGYERMIPASTKRSHPVHYIHGSPFDAHRILVDHITTFLDQGFKPEDIFVLAPSVKVKGKATPTRVLENALVAKQIPIYVSNDEEKELSTNSESPTNGKLVITTFHQSKGLERDIVIIYSFDDSYYENKDYDRNFLCSPLYVAITRARKYLYVIHDSKQAPFRFFRPPQNSECIVYLNTRGDQIAELPAFKELDKTEQHKNNRVFLASDLTNYLPSQAIFEAHSYLNVRTVCVPEIKIPLVSMIQTGPRHWESVADLNGVAVPALYEWRAKNNMRITSLDNETVVKEGGRFVKRYLEIQNLVKNNAEPPISLILEAANIFSAMFSGYHYKVAQIQDYSWMTTNEIEPCMEILSDHLMSDDTQYEVVIPEQICKQATIRGRIDAYSENASTLWEIKCTDTLDMAHDIQLGVYAWMFWKAVPQRFNEISCHLLNIRTGECRKIVTKGANLDSMMHFLIAEKTRRLIVKTDEDFISTFSAKFDESNTTSCHVTKSDMVRVKNVAPEFIDDSEPPPAPKPKKPSVKKARVDKKDMVVEPQTGGDVPMENEIISAPQQAAQVVDDQLDKVQIETPEGKVIVFDLETTGLPTTPSFGTYYPPTELDKYRQSRIVQWSWSLHEADGTLIAEEDHIIKPNFAEYRIMNTQFHGITEDIARVRGKTFEEVLERWSTHLADATTVVGHNVNFDKHVLLSELHRRGHTISADILLKKSWACTMTRAKELCGLRASNKLKPPKLRELMHALGVEEEPGRAFHNAKHDVYYTARCYFAEQVLKNPCPKMYEGKHAGKTYDEILKIDMLYVANSMAVCNVRKLYSSPLRKLSNWGKTKLASTPGLAEAVAAKEVQIRGMAP